MNLSAVILAGGESRRMGRDKSRLKLAGQTLLARALGTVRELGAGEIFISGRTGEDYSRFGCPVLTDLEPGFGPVGGIERALHAAHCPLLLVLAVDLPRMTASFLRQLVAPCDVVTGALPRLREELEPLVAIYPRGCHALASTFITQHRHSARDFAEVCLRERAVRVLPVAKADEGCFNNCNTPDEFALVSAGSCRKSMSPGWECA